MANLSRTQSEQSTRALLESAWSALDGPTGGAENLRLTGEWGDLLPSTLPCLPAMSAAVASAVLAVAAVDAARQGGPPQDVTVDIEHVAVAALSERYARLEGSPPPDLFAPLSRLWPAEDGWLRLHTHYPWHRARALEVLRCADTPAAVGAAIALRGVAELEESFAAAGGLAFVVRSRQEWAEHPQGQAVAKLPLLETAPAGAAGQRPTPVGSLLQGFRVLDLTRVLAGPVATRTLAAWGAQVLRIDSPDLPEIAELTIDTLSGKRSALLDISTELDMSTGPGHARLHQLLSEADVLIHGYRPGALSRYGLSAAALATRHPHLTVVSISAWGRTGPWSGRRGFDSLVQCPTGIAEAESREGIPGVLPAQVLDHATGYLAAAAAALSLAEVVRGLPPRHALLSLAQTAAWLQTPQQREAPEFRQDTDKRAARPAPTTPDAAPFMVSLSGGARRVRVVRPPGLLGDQAPVWSGTTSLGYDRAAFDPGE